MTRAFQKRADASPSAVPRRPVKQFVRGSLLRPAAYDSVSSLCTNCGPKTCVRFVEPEIPAGAPLHAQRVCPTDAIQYAERERTVAVTDACIKCGLCVVRCPYGAIFFGDGQAAALPFDAVTYVDANEAEAATLLKLPQTTKIPPAEVRDVIERAFAAQVSTDKNVFYPLVASILTATGLYTRVTRAGDTNNRMDAVSVDAKESIPIEIKSPTEVRYINVKAVRQAVENKIVMTARNMFPTTMETSTLAIGYEYPNDRSDVDDLVEDMAKTYGINVGLVSLRDLYTLLWKRFTTSDTTVASSLRRLKGRFNAAV